VSADGLDGWQNFAVTVADDQARQALLRRGFARKDCLSETSTPPWRGSTTPCWSTSRRHDRAAPQPTTARPKSTRPVAGSADWLRLARIARILVTDPGAPPTPGIQDRPVPRRPPTPAYPAYLTAPLGDFRLPATR
jgi:hypothetical protein